MDLSLPPSAADAAQAQTSTINPAQQITLGNLVTMDLTGFCSGSSAQSCPECVPAQAVRVLWPPGPAYTPPQSEPEVGLRLQRVQGARTLVLHCSRRRQALGPSVGDAAQALLRLDMPLVR